MSQCEIEFSYDGKITIIQCTKEEKVKDIYKSFKFKAQVEKEILIYIYNGITLQNEELTFNEVANSEDKKRNKMNIVVDEGEAPESPANEIIIKSNNVICPVCREDIKFKIEDYKINLFECKNGHYIDNIFLDKFNLNQNINISKIICQNCGNNNKGNIHEKIFYRCNSCKKNLCPICYSSHDKNHNVINYDDKNYICDKHNKLYTGYCKDCKENICVFCEQDHNKHNICLYGKLIPDNNKMNKILKELEEAKNKLNKNINNIIEKLNKVKDYYEHYYKINKNIIDNFNKLNKEKKINYEILYNINNINNNDIIKDINNIIKNKSIQNKFNKLIKIYNKMNNIKYL